MAKVQVKLLRKHYLKDRLFDEGAIVEVDEKAIGKHMKRLDGEQKVAAPAENDPAKGAKPSDIENRILEALTALDPTNDEHWTAKGKPSVDAVSALVGMTVSRSEIEAVASDLERPQ